MAFPHGAQYTRVRPGLFLLGGGDLGISWEGVCAEVACKEVKLGCWARNRYSGKLPSSFVPDSYLSHINCRSPAVELN